MNSDSSSGSPSSRYMPMTSAKFCCNSSKVSPLRMGAGEARDVPDKQPCFRAALDHSRVSWHVYLQAQSLPSDNYLNRVQ
jgi:hypothetical protein